MRQRRRKHPLKSFAQAKWMIRHGVGKRLFRWLRKKPALCTYVDSMDFCLIVHAARHRRHDVVVWLLKQGINPDLHADWDNTALIQASLINDVRMINTLLDAGADIERCNESYETPLGYACAYDAVDAVRVLCERGANVNGTEGWGHSYLWGVQCAIPRDESGKQRVIEQILLAHGARVIEEPPKLKWP